MFDPSERPWEVPSHAAFAAQGVHADFQAQSHLLMPYYQQPISGPSMASLVPINAPPAAFGPLHTSAQPYAFCNSAGDLLARMEGLRLNPMAKPFELMPQERDKGCGRDRHAGHSVGYSSGRECYASHAYGSRGACGPSAEEQFGGSRARSAAGARNAQPGRSRALNRRTINQKQMEENVRRTVYICDIDQQVTEEQLAAAFQECGQVVDCRVCGDPNSAMRFAFIEFYSEDGVHKAIATMNGAMVGAYPLRVLPSKTAIVPVNNQFLPRTPEERELCGRTVYVANIDKKVDKQHVLAFFEKQCGPVSRIRLLGDHHHQTRIAFVEFQEAKHAKEALDCSGALLGSLPIRVSPSKAPVRDDPPPR